MTGLGGEFVGTLVLIAGLAALMSTMDSQLLTLSSIISRDLWPVFTRRQATGIRMARVLVAALAGLGLLIALTTDATILDLGVTAFTGFAVLFPTVLFGLYLRQPRPAAALASICSGQALVLVSHFGTLPATGFLSAIPAMACATAVYVAVHLLTGPAGLPTVTRRQALFAIGFGAIFVLAQDFWRWGEMGPVVLGMPTWCWYFLGLSAAQTLLVARMTRIGRHVRPPSLSRLIPHT